MAGWVYILTNDSFEDLIKIGMTGGLPKDRAEKLSQSTGVPTPFRVRYGAYVRDEAALEKAVHVELAHHRVNDGREFFRVASEEAISTIQKIGEVLFEQVNEEILVSTSQEAAEESLAEVPPKSIVERVSPKSANPPGFSAKKIEAVCDGCSKEIKQTLTRYENLVWTCEHCGKNNELRVCW